MIDLEKVKTNKLGFFRFKQFSDTVLLTNIIGEYIFLNKKDFKRFVEGDLAQDESAYIELKSKNFIANEPTKEELAQRYRQRNQFLWWGPVLHIIIPTLRCDHRCLYCQASSVGLQAKDRDMSKQTAKKAVDTIFQSPSESVIIEFQGGEPLLNWNTVKFICSYAREKEQNSKKKLMLALVTNLNQMDEKKLNFLKQSNVSICTSLDGPKFIHDKNRIMLQENGSSYERLANWIPRIIEKYKNPKSLNALTTITKEALSYPKDIIDEYCHWNFDKISLRPLSNLGFSRTMKDQIGYDVSQFMQFYKQGLDYLIKLNLAGKTKMSESTAVMFLTKILLGKDPNFLDTRSPCGAGIGQLVYNYDGKVYTCDEARMIGEDIFALGNINRNSYSEIVSSSTTKATCMSSVTDTLYCDYCVYKPYCGVCPVCNYKETGNLYAQMHKNQKCQLDRAILDYLFEKLQHEQSKEVLTDWLFKR
jgi:His-Xaa-Ser system radical SAM maturase HxsB